MFALTDGLLEFLDAAQHGSALGLQTLLELAGGRELDAKFVELLGRRFLLARFALGLFHGGRRLAIGFFDLPPAHRNTVRQFLRLLLGQVEVLPGTLLFARQRGGTPFRIVQLLFEQAVVGPQTSQLVLLVAHTGAGGFERFLFSFATGEHAEARGFVAPQLGLHGGQL